MNRFILALLLLLSVCSGCMTFQKLDQIILVNMIAIDMAKTGNNLVVSLGTYDVTKPNESQSSSSSSGNRSEAAKTLLSAQGETLGQAIANLRAISPEKIDFSHNRLLVIGRPLAQKSIRPFLDYLERNSNLRSSMDIMVAVGEARQILETKQKVDRGNTNALELLLEVNQQNNLNFEVPIYDFLRNLKSATGVAVIPEVQATGQSQFKLEQAAVFKKDKMVGILPPPRTKTLQWLAGKIQGQSLTFPCKLARTKTQVTIIVRRARLSIKPLKRQNTFRIQINAAAVARLVDTSPLLQSKLGPKVVRQFQSAANRYVKKQLEDLVEYSQQTLATDLLGFGEKINNEYPYSWRKLRSKWDRIFPTIKSGIAVQLQIEDMGMVKNAL